MKKRCVIWITFFSIVLFSSSLLATEKADVIVAQDSSGDFTSIQDAINSIPLDNNELKIILIKNGFYEEPVMIDRDYVALVGEDRYNTIISASRRYNIDSSAYYDALYAPVGRGIINVYADHVTIANLTAENTQPSTGVHAFTINGDSRCNRTIVINCNITSNGGDTMALWNTASGMQYHNTIYMKGAHDFYCPRGWAYAENIEFYCTRTTTPLWHDGSLDINMKSVVKNSSMDGATIFDIGRNHVDAAFYLLNMEFSENMSSQPFKQAGTEYKWGRRYYFDDCSRPAGNYDWFKDNMITASGSPRPEEITAKWTFATNPEPWDPEAEMPSVLPMSFLPKPDNNKIRVDLSPELTWVPGRNAQSHNIYFGTTNPPPMVINTTERSYNPPGTLLPNTVYYWRVDEVDGDDVVEGEVWQFHTQVDNLPPKVTLINPENQALIDVDAPLERLIWAGDSIQTDVYKTYFGTHPDSLELVSTYSVAGYYLPPLHVGQTYYWRVDAENQVGTTQGDVWQFSMKESSFSKPDYYQTNDEKGLVVIEAENFTDSTNIGDHYWQLVTDPGDYSGSGAMQALPDNGTFYNTRYSERSSRLDYAVDFVKTGTHYIWIRAYAPNDRSRYFHVGINLIEDKDASRIGYFREYGQWEWINALVNDSTLVRSFQVGAIGTQGVSLWFGEDGVIADKIVITTDPDYIPTGLGPDATTAIEKPVKNQRPIRFNLYQNYPNPFNPVTTIRYDLARASHVELTIYDNLGRKVTTLIKAFQNAGNHSVRWEALDEKGNKLAGGIYFARIKAESVNKSIKLLYLP